MTGWHTPTEEELLECPFIDCSDPKEVALRYQKNQQVSEEWEEWLERQTR